MKATTKTLARLSLTGAFLLSGSLVHGQISGAIFTTDKHCDGTDLNIYHDKSEVFLDGGPRKDGAAGLPDGFYHVQVTSPNGIVLGSSLYVDCDTPPVQVLNGKFVTCYELMKKGNGPGDPVLRKQSSWEQDGPGEPDGYDDTPNNGDEYKVWVSMAPNCDDFTFPNSESKTDNFKVKKGRLPDLTSICALKYYDANANGVQDPGEVVIPDWQFQLWTNVDGAPGEMIGCQLTDGGGEACFLVETDGTSYFLMEVFPNDSWVSTTDDTVLVTADSPVVSVGFGNICLIVVDFSTKGYWHNKNGITELNSIPGKLEEVLAECVHPLKPYSAPSSYFGAGDEPFDGQFADGTLVAASPGVLGEPDIAPEGSKEAEISQFLVDPNGDGGQREQLAQQLLAFIFNMKYRAGSAYAAILLPDSGSLISGIDLINAAVDAWCGTDVAEQTAIKDILDAFNNSDAVEVSAAAPCPFDPLPCPAP